MLLCLLCLLCLLGLLGLCTIGCGAPPLTWSAAATEGVKCGVWSDSFETSNKRAEKHRVNSLLTQHLCVAF